MPCRTCSALLQVAGDAKLICIHLTVHSSRANGAPHAISACLQSTNFDLEFVHINCQSLAASVKEEAMGWVLALSQCMRELDTQALEVCLYIHIMARVAASLYAWAAA